MRDMIALSSGRALTVGYMPRGYGAGEHGPAYMVLTVPIYTYFLMDLSNS